MNGDKNIHSRMSNLQATNSAKDKSYGVIGSVNKKQSQNQSLNAKQSNNKINTHKESVNMNQTNNG